MAPRHQRLLDFKKLGTQPLGNRFSPDREDTIQASSRTDMREPQKVERFRFALATTEPVFGREPAELDQSRLLRVQVQSEFVHPVPKCCEEAFGLPSMLETYYEVISVSDDDDLPGGVSLTPPVNPEVQCVVQKHVGERIVGERMARIKGRGLKVSGTFPGAAPGLEG